MLYKFSIFFLALCFFCALFAPFLSPYDPNLINLENIKFSPNLNYIFGTDFLGRDEFSRALYGLRASLFIAVLSGIFASMFAFLFLFVFWNSNKFIKGLLMRGIDAFLSLPILLIILFVGALFDGNLGIVGVGFLIGAFSWVSMAKVLVDEFSSISKMEFVQNAIGLGASKFRLIFGEILPMARSRVLLLFITTCAHATGFEATLSFFGIGLGLGEASLGTMLNDASKAIFMGAWWLVLVPGLCIFLLIFSMINLAEGLKIDRS